MIRIFISQRELSSRLILTLAIIGSLFALRAHAKSESVSIKELTEVEIQLLKYGQKPTHEWDKLNNIVSSYEEFSNFRKESQPNIESTDLCQLFFENNTRLDQQLLNILDRASQGNIAWVNSKPNDYFYSRARIEVLSSFMELQLNLVKNFSESGLSPFGVHKEPCSIKDRNAWIKNQESRLILIRIAYTVIWPSRGLKNNYDLSVWLSNKFVEKNEIEANQLLILTGSSFLVYPAISFFMPMIASKIGFSAVLGKKVATYAVTGYYVLSGAFNGAIQLKKEPPIRNEPKKIQNNLESFLNTPLGDPEAYVYTIMANEKNNDLVLRKYLNLQIP